jgi:hypothetical protein
LDQIEKIKDLDQVDTNNLNYIVDGPMTPEKIYKIKEEFKIIKETFLLYQEGKVSKKAALMAKRRMDAMVYLIEKVIKRSKKPTLKLIK